MSENDDDTVTLRITGSPKALAKFWDSVSTVGAMEPKPKPPEPKPERHLRAVVAGGQKR